MKKVITPNQKLLAARLLSAAQQELLRDAAADLAGFGLPACKGDLDRPASLSMLSHTAIKIAQEDIDHTEMIKKALSRVDL